MAAMYVSLDGELLKAKGDIENQIRTYGGASDSKIHALPSTAAGTVPGNR